LLKYGCYYSEYYSEVLSGINVGKAAEKSFGETVLKWAVRYIRFNFVGFIVFLIGTVIFEFTFHTLGAWSWFVASAVGGILQFILISYLNRTTRGKIFDTAESKETSRKD